MKRISTKTCLALAPLALLAACASAPKAPTYTAENTLVVPPITYGTTAAGIVLSAEDDRCDSPGTLRQGIQWNLPWPLVNEVEVPPQGVTGLRTLKVEIVDILAPGGGHFSGPKMLIIKGTLLKEGAQPLQFTAVRRTFPGVMPRTTCNMMGRITERLGNDIGLWLVHPVDGAKLGDRWE